MSENKKPRICEVLGVEVGEEWQVSNGGYTYRIGSSGRREIKAQNGCWVSADTEALLTDIINHPERIIRKPRWTEDDIADAKAVRRLWPDTAKIQKKRGVNRNVICRFGDTVGSIDCASCCFPSLKLDETVTLDEIL